MFDEFWEVVGICLRGSLEVFGRFWKVTGRCLRGV